MYNIIYKQAEEWHNNGIYLEFLTSTTADNHN